MAQQAREHRLIPEYTENFFKKAFTKIGGKFRELKDGFLAIDSVPYELRKIAQDDNFKKSYGQLIKRYPKVTFDKEIAFKNPDVEFISFGHSLFEAVMVWIKINLSDSLINGATFIDPDGKMNGYILFYEGEIKDGTGSVAGKRLFSFYVNEEKVRPIPPAIIWDLEEEHHLDNSTVDIESLKNKTVKFVIQKIEEYKEEILEERNRQASIKEKYGIKSLEYLILKLDGDLISLYARKEMGENVNLAIRNKEERKKEYERALNELKEKINKEKSLTMSMPHFIGIIRVKPKETIDKAMQTDEEIERLGMQIAMEYERKKERMPEDVSSENLGFDIRSKDEDGNIRYIEVKARKERRAVALTKNEWFKATRFKDEYYLYAVMNATKNPGLYIIQNPAKELNPEEKIEVVRYVVPFKELKEKGEIKL